MKYNCLVACRVSGTRQAQEGESLGTQEKICRGIAEAKDSRVLKVFYETYSGRKNHRPVVEDIKNFIKQCPEVVHYVIFRGIDRFTRRGAAGYDTLKADLAALGVSIIDSYGIIQPPQNTLAHLGVEYEWSTYSPSEIAELVMATTAKNEVTTILTRLIGREIELTRQGYQIGAPSDGYLNQKVMIDGKKKTIQAADPERAQFYQAMFELRAKRRYSDAQVVKKVNAMGFLTKRRNVWNDNHTEILGATGGRPLTVKQFQKILTHTIYCGVICEKWTDYKPIRAQYPGLVSIETFNQANQGQVHIEERSDGSLQILYDHQPTKLVKKRLREHPLFPFKGVILCPHCRRPFYASCPQGKSGKGFPTYHCSRGHRYFGVSKSTVEGTLAGFVRSLRYRPGLMATLEGVVLDVYERQHEEIQKSEVDIKRQLAQLKAQKEQAVSALLSTTSELARAEIEKRLEALQERMEELERAELPELVSKDLVASFLEAVRFVLEHLDILLWDGENVAQRQAIFSLIFEKLPTYDELAFGTPQLSLVFELSRQLEEGKSPVVDQWGFEPQTFALQRRCSTS